MGVQLGQYSFISADFANVSLKLNAEITVAVIYCHTKVSIA